MAVTPTDMLALQLADSLNGVLPYAEATSPPPEKDLEAALADFDRPVVDVTDMDHGERVAAAERLMAAQEAAPEPPQPPAGQGPAGALGELVAFLLERDAQLMSLLPRAIDAVAYFAGEIDPGPEMPAVETAAAPQATEMLLPEPPAQQYAKVVAVYDGGGSAPETGEPAATVTANPVTDSMGLNVDEDTTLYLKAAETRDGWPSVAYYELEAGNVIAYTQGDGRETVPGFAGETYDGVIVPYAGLSGAQLGQDGRLKITWDDKKLGFLRKEDGFAQDHHKLIGDAEADINGPATGSWLEVEVIGEDGNEQLKVKTVGPGVSAYEVGVEDCACNFVNYADFDLMGHMRKIQWYSATAGLSEIMGPCA